MPLLPVQYSTYLGMTDMKASSQHSPSKGTGQVQAPNLLDVRSTEFGSWITLALTPIRYRLRRMLFRMVPKVVRQEIVSTPLCAHIAHIVCLTTQKQMGRIRAFRVIATMAHFKAVWNGTTMQCPRNPVRQQFISARYIDDAIPRILVRTSPSPAAVCHMRVLPESVGKGTVTLSTLATRHTTVPLFLVPLLIGWVEKFAALGAAEDDCGRIGVHGDLLTGCCAMPGGASNTAPAFTCPIIPRLGAI